MKNQNLRNLIKLSLKKKRKNLEYLGRKEIADAGEKLTKENECLGLIVPSGDNSIIGVGSIAKTPAQLPSVHGTRVTVGVNVHRPRKIKNVNNQNILNLELKVKMKDLMQNLNLLRSR